MSFFPIWPILGNLNDEARRLFWEVLADTLDIDEVPEELYTEMDALLGKYLEGSNEVSLEDIKETLENVLLNLGVTSYKSKAEEIWEKFRKKLRRFLTLKRRKEKKKTVEAIFEDVEL